MPSKRAALDAVAREVAACRLCRRGTEGLPVPGEGMPDARVVFVGEAPGRQEAETGRPFVGRAGKLLRELVRTAGLQDRDVFITSALKYLPRTGMPTPAQVRHARRHLLAQLDVIRPQVVVLLGRVACLSVLERPVAVAKEHGQVVAHGGFTCLIAYHPAAALHASAARAPLRRDFLKLRRLLKAA